MNGSVLSLEVRLDSGDMPDFASSTDLPWAAGAQSITKAVIQNGITRIGANAFAEYVNIKDVVYIGGKDGWKAIQANSDANNAPIFAVSPHLPVFWHLRRGRYLLL